MIDVAESEVLGNLPARSQKVDHHHLFIRIRTGTAFLNGSSTRVSTAGKVRPNLHLPTWIQVSNRANDVCSCTNAWRASRRPPGLPMHRQTPDTPLLEKKYVPKSSIWKQLISRRDRNIRSAISYFLYYHGFSPVSILYFDIHVGEWPMVRHTCLLARERCC